MADLGAAQIAVAKMFGLAAGEREHLRRFQTFMRSRYYRDNAKVNATDDECIDLYVQWLKAGEPA